MASITRRETQAYFKELIKNKRQSMSPAARERNKSLRVSSTWLYPWKVEKSYSAYIKGIMAQFSAIALPAIRENLNRWLDEMDIFDATEGLYVKDEYDDEFNELLDDLRDLQNETFVEDEDEVKAEIFGHGAEVNAINRAQWSKITTLAIGTAFDVDSGWVQGTLKSWTDLNFTLVKSLSDEYIKKVNTIVAEGVQQGARYTDIMGDLRKMDKNMTKARAELIARDQVGKLNGSLTEGRMVDAGVGGYIWLTALDERVRSTHRQMSGSTNKWDDRSVYKPRGANKFKKRPSAMSGAIPGSKIQCRCTALPAFDDIVADVDELIAQEEKANPDIALNQRKIPATARRSKAPKIKKAKKKPVAKPKKKDTRDDAPKQFNFKNNKEAEAAIEAMGVKKAHFGTADRGFSEGMAEALNRVPKDIDLGALDSVGTFAAIKPLFGTAKGTKGLVGANISQVSIDQRTKEVENKQGVFWNTAPSIGKKPAEQFRRHSEQNAISRERRGHDWAISSNVNGPARHEVGHFIFYNKHGFSSDKNEEMRKAWSATVKKHWAGPQFEDFEQTQRGLKQWTEALNAYQKPQYARSDDDEAWAEAWAAYVDPEDRKKLPSGVVKWIKQEVDQ